MSKQIENPFRHPGFPGWGVEYTETVDAPGRLEMIHAFNIDQLRAVIAMPNVQKTVRQAAERRLRKLEREI